MSSRLAAVVLAVGAPAELADAVRSLLAQPPECELLVVNSGGGDAAARLRGAGLEVPVREHPTRLLPGAARNAGLAATHAPYVAFLAADCIALEGWTAARADLHAQGVAVVASAVVNPYRRNPSAWATQTLLFARRTPGIPEERALLYGCSYDRALFARFGSFRGDLRAGEDTEMHRRFDDSVGIRWCPRVRTAHRHPTTPWGLLGDQYARGGRAARAWAALGRASRGAVARAAFARLRSCADLAWRTCEPADRKWLALALPLLPIATFAYALGALRARVDPPPEPACSAA